ncbi:MAG: SAM-dependent methyltransferase [Lachnospiraceae bacterium]|nr:SAM-dependent methyltransferase [Lachnospiraceae bacterium]
MDEIRSLLEQVLTADLIQINMSNTRDAQQASKAKIRPVLIGGQLLFQETLYRGTQVFHSNFTGAEMQEKIMEYLAQLFKQAQIQSTQLEATILVSKKGKITLKKKLLSSKASNQQESAQSGITDRTSQLAHNRTKQYILQDGKPVDFLVGLGVQSPDGKVTKAKYDKFRQINRYLEFIEDVLHKLPNDRPIRIIDFGCGKSYLTFAMYYYLHVLQGRDIRVTGLDLKKDVIDHCNQLARQLHYDRLHFEHGDIAHYTGADAVDMVVTLHACDTATDYAIAKAIGWNARVIMVVPCCQHEVNKQIQNRMLQPVLKYGLIKERVSALLTDAMRANLMEQAGYDTQILEFIDMEHTPKNLLIRAVKSEGMRKRGNDSDITGLAEQLQVELTLQKLLKDNKE